MLVAGNTPGIASIAIHLLGNLVTEPFDPESSRQFSAEREGAFFARADRQCPIIETRCGLAIACAHVLCDNVANSPRRDTVVKLVLIQLDRDSREVLSVAGPVKSYAGGSLHHDSTQNMGGISRRSACRERPCADQAEGLDDKVAVWHVTNRAPEKPVEWAAGQLCQDGLGPVPSRCDGDDGPEEQGMLLKIEVGRLIWVEEREEAVVVGEEFLEKTIDVSLGQAHRLELISIVCSNTVGSAPLEREERIDSLVRPHQGGVPRMRIGAVGNGRLELRVLEVVIVFHGIALSSGLCKVATQPVDLLLHLGMLGALADALEVGLYLALELEAVAP